MTNQPAVLRIAQVVACTEAEGPGRRFAVWFQGCPLRCPDCCNPEMLPFEAGELVPVADLLNQVQAARDQFGVEGVTLLGGEPFAHAEPAAAFAAEVQALDLSVMVFSGYTLEELRAMPDPAVADLLRFTDLLIDGRYERDLPDTTRRWIGSANQRIHCLTDRYSADDACWRQADTLEIRWNGSELTVNGFPAPGAKSLWKQLEPRRSRSAASKQS